jgi:hypothetical protein
MSAFSFSDAIAVVALIVSVCAFIVAVYAIFQAARYRRGDILIEVAREREPLEDLLRSLDEQSLQLRPDIFLSMGMSLRKSDDERRLDTEVQRIGAELVALRADLAKLPGPDGIRTHFRAEKVLASLIRLRVRAEALQQAIRACRIKVDAARSNRFPRLR